MEVPFAFKLKFAGKLADADTATLSPEFIIVVVTEGDVSVS